ncbi:LacI family DNA-binding transcriptional regulator [Cupriavidus basilensis]
MTTVSHALNDRGVVDPATRARVKRIAAELGYRPSVRAAPAIRPGELHCAAVVDAVRSGWRHVAARVHDGGRGHCRGSRHGARPRGGAGAAAGRGRRTAGNARLSMARS